MPNINKTVNKLPRLNDLLNNKKLNLPDHRREVSSDTHLKWLAQHIKERNPDVPEEIMSLLAMTLNQLKGK